MLRSPLLYVYVSLLSPPFVPSLSRLQPQFSSIRRKIVNIINIGFYDCRGKVAFLTFRKTEKFKNIIDKLTGYVDLAEVFHWSLHISINCGTALQPINEGIDLALGPIFDRVGNAELQSFSLHARDFGEHRLSPAGSISLYVPP